MPDPASLDTPWFHFPEPSQIQWTSTDQDVFREEFVISASDALEALEGAALQIGAGPGSAAALGEAKRILHTLKGDCGVIGLPVLSDTCHRAETALGEIESDHEATAEFLLQFRDWFAKALAVLSWEEEPAPPAESAPQPGSPQARPAPGELRTLIVEDDFTSRLLLQEILRVLGPVHIAVNGAEAVEAVERAIDAREHYHAVFLDIMMPEMDGHQALRGFRSLEEAEGIPPSRGAKVVMITALGDIKNVMEAFHGLCDAYLVKPIVRAQILEELRKLELIV